MPPFRLARLYSPMSIPSPTYWLIPCTSNPSILPLPKPALAILSTFPTRALRRRWMVARESTFWPWSTSALSAVCLAFGRQDDGHQRQKGGQPGIEPGTSVNLVPPRIEMKALRQHNKPLYDWPLDGGRASMMKVI
ncbi:hypothetical protein L1887_63369 [Cichorium endivia]|nr:hypothetical protein L1887_63369 [Cichorium endivia]